MKKGLTWLSPEEKADLVDYAAQHGKEAALKEFGISRSQLNRILATPKREAGVVLSDEYIKSVISELRGKTRAERLLEIIQEVPSMLERLIMLERERLDKLRVGGPSPLERITVTEPEGAPKKAPLRWRMGK